MKREERKYNRCREEGIILVRIRESSTDPAVKICDYTIHVSASLDDAIKELNRFICLPANINTYRDRLEIRAQYLEKRNGNTLDIIFPHLVKEWNCEKNH